jgi:hypothetical protein
MKKFVLVLAFAATAALAAEPSGKILYVYDEVNANSTPYIALFKEALAGRGLAFEEATAEQLATKDLSSHDLLLIHGMVMAFNMSSPIRDWLKKGPDLGGKKVSLFVTANRWFLNNLFEDLSKLLNKDKAEVVDAVSMATKDMDSGGKAAAVKAHVARLK